MSDAPVQTRQDAAAVPQGFLRPTGEIEVRALVALEAGRIEDAEKHLSRLSGREPVQRAWKLLLTGRVAAEQGRLTEAEPLLLQGASLALIAAMSTGDVPDHECFRLSAAALHHLGRVYRRQDRAEEAFPTHVAAYNLRDRHGSCEERWETAVELGLDADVARQFERAERWYRTAVEAGEACSHEPARRQADALTHLSSSLTEADRHDEAVAAARSARDHWHEHDVSAATATQADMGLGSALLALGEASCGADGEQASRVLHEAKEFLTGAREGLMAFGSTYDADAQTCRDQVEIAGRLIESLGA